MLLTLSGHCCLKDGYAGRKLFVEHPVALRYDRRWRSMSYEAINFGRKFEHEQWQPSAAEITITI
jgi:hypothetical protein